MENIVTVLSAGRGIHFPSCYNYFVIENRKGILPYVERKELVTNCGETSILRTNLAIWLLDGLWQFISSLKGYLVVKSRVYMRINLFYSPNKNKSLLIFLRSFVNDFCNLFFFVTYHVRARRNLARKKMLSKFLATFFLLEQ